MRKRTDKDMTVVRRTAPFAQSLKNRLTSVDLSNYAGNGKAVRLAWNMNDSATRDKMMVIRVGDQEAIIDLEELLSYTRLV